MIFGGATADDNGRMMWSSGDGCPRHSWRMAPDDCSIKDNGLEWPGTLVKGSKWADGIILPWGRAKRWGEVRRWRLGFRLWSHHARNF